MAPSTTHTAPGQIEPRSQQSLWSDRSFTWLTRIFAFGIAGVLIFIGIQVAIDAFPEIQRYGLSFITTSAWNPVEDDYRTLPMIYGTLVSSLIALLLAVPIGGGTAVFLSQVSGCSSS